MCGMVQYGEDFNPRSLAGATHSKNFTVLLRLRFQSTLPRGSDKVSRIGQMVRMYFNPRSLAGATFGPTMGLLDPVISIHAPSRERPGRPGTDEAGQGFQSTLPRGSDQN